MTKEQKFFLILLSDYLQKRKTSIPSDIDWSRIKQYAKSHQVEGIVYYQTKRPDFQSSFAMCQYMYVNYKKNWEEINTKLNALGIEHFLVKGLLLSEVYPVSSLRTMGDIDVVIHEKDREKVHGILCGLGFINRSHDNHEWIYFKNGVEIEVHSQLFYTDVRNTDAIMKFEIEKWNWFHNGELDWNYHFVFLLLHFRKHFLGEGVGFRQLMDIAVISDNIELDYKWINTKLEELEVLDFFNVCRELIECLKNQIITADQEEKLLFLLKNGVFGFENENAQKNKVVNKFNAYGRIGLAISFCKDLLYPYNKLIQLEEFSFLVGKKYLLPCAWIIRALRRYKARNQIISRYSVSNDFVEQRNKMLNTWGLNKN